MTRDDDDLVVVPAHEFPWTCADRLAIGLVAKRLDVGRRHHHAGAVRQDRRQRGVRVLQPERDLQRTGHIDRFDAGQVRLHVGALVGAVTVEVELDGLGIHRRAVVECDAGGDVEHHRLGIGERPLRHTRLRLEGLVVPFDQRVIHRPQDAVIGAGTTSGRIKRRWIGGRGDFQHAAFLGFLRPRRQAQRACYRDAAYQCQNVATT